jgi:hypothetical protein
MAVRELGVIRLPYEIEHIGACTREVAQQVANVIAGAAHRPRVEIRADWYY